MFFRVLSKIFSLYLFRLGEAVLVGVFKKVLFPQRVAIEKRQKLRDELYFYVPQWVEHETSVFMRFSRKYFVFSSKLAYLISC